MSRAPSGMVTEWGDPGGGDAGWGLQKKPPNIWEWLAMGGKGREEEGIPNDSRMFALGD